MLNKETLKKIPSKTGIYKFLNHSGKIIYIGKALRLNDRVKSYFREEQGIKNQHLIKNIAEVSWIEVSSEVEALILEANLIKKHLPRYNLSLRDDKSFLYIALTSEEFPRVITARKNQQDVNIKKLFGPYPSSQAVRDVMKLIRKAVPFCTQSPRLKKACFYSHIRLCGPCPGEIRNIKNRQKRWQLSKIYKSNIKKIDRILSGKLPDVRRELIKQMNAHAKNLQFEEDKNIKNQIDRLAYITRPYYNASSFLKDENFLEKAATQNIEDLYSILGPHFTNLKNVSTFERIECIDIATLMGSQSTGSLVVFLNGQKSPSDYKRFNIRLKDINDVKMINEVLTRRLKHAEWPLPQLFVIDGGKPQVSEAQKVLKNYNIPLIGLAKRYETIIIPKSNQFVSLSLKPNSPALKLLMEMRDEAHRFARSYHHHLRKKLITQVTG